MQGRIGLGEVLLIEAAALATASAATGLPALHQLFKPLVMLVAIFLVAHQWSTTERKTGLALLLARADRLAGR